MIRDLARRRSPERGGYDIDDKGRAHFVISDEPLRSQLQQEPYKIVDGYFEIPDRPGLGVEINEDYLDRDDLIPRDMYAMIQPKL